MINKFKNITKQFLKQKTSIILKILRKNIYILFIENVNSVCHLGSEHVCIFQHRKEATQNFKKHQILR